VKSTPAHVYTSQWKEDPDDGHDVRRRNDALNNRIPSLVRHRGSGPSAKRPCARTMCGLDRASPTGEARPIL